jgi:RNA polymerase sigma factor (TIGR02999 family)
MAEERHKHSHQGQSPPATIRLPETKPELARRPLSPPSEPNPRWETPLKPPIDDIDDAGSSAPAPAAAFTDAARPPGAVTRLLNEWSQGDTAALDELLPLVYDELRQLARRHLRHERDNHTLEGTGLVHEAFIRLSQHGPIRWESRSHFYAWASTLMRHILIDYARARQAAKRGSGVAPQSLDALQADTAERPGLQVAEPGSESSLTDLLALDHALTRLETLDQQQSRVVELRFFGGLSVVETAEALHISPATVKREWATARAWLLRELGRLAPASAPLPAR